MTFDPGRDHMIKRTGTSLSLVQKSRGVGLFDSITHTANPYYFSIGAIFLLSSRRCTENGRPFVLLRDVVTKETKHKTYHYIIQHFLTTSDRRQRDEMSGFCKAIASKAAAFQALDRLDTKLDAF